MYRKCYYSGCNISVHIYCKNEECEMMTIIKESFSTGRETASERYVDNHHLPMNQRKCLPDSNKDLEFLEKRVIYI